MESDESLGEYDKGMLTKEWASVVIKETQIPKEIWELYKVLGPKASQLAVRKWIWQRIQKRGHHRALTSPRFSLTSLCYLEVTSFLKVG